MKSIQKGKLRSKTGKEEVVGIISGVETSGPESVQKWLKNSKVLSELQHSVRFELIAHEADFDQDQYSLLIFVVDLEKPESNIACNQWFHRIRSKYPCLVLADNRDSMPDASDDNIVTQVKEFLNIPDADRDPGSSLAIKPVSAKRLNDNVNFKEGDYEEVFEFIHKCLKTQVQSAVSIKHK